MKTWRRLQQIGAVPARNSVYVLPNTEQCREDFEWIRSDIAALGGEATVFAADALDGAGAEDIVATFQRTRAADYRTLKRDIDRALSARRGKGPTASARRDGSNRAVRSLRERFSEIERIDFFNAAARHETAESLARLEQAVGNAKTPVPRLAAPRLSPRTYRNRRWVTRPRPGVDRMASAWLVRRFIDPKAVFAFVAKPGRSDVPFDMYVGDFSHQGDLCTFETLVERFGLEDATVTRIAQIVHDLDMKETRYAPPEAPAVGRLVEGLRLLHADDAVLLRQGMEMFEALARSFGESKAAGKRR